MSFECQFAMSGFSSHAGSLPVFTNSSVHSLESRIGCDMFRRVGIFDAELRIETELSLLEKGDSNGNPYTDTEIIESLSHFERVYPEDNGLMSAINDRISENIRAVYTRSGKLESYKLKLKKEVRLSKITPFDELPYDGLTTCNWLDSRPSLTSVQQFNPVAMTKTMYTELLLKGMKPKQISPQRFFSHDQVFGRTGFSDIFPSCSMKIKDRIGDEVSINASIDGKNFSRVLTHEKAKQISPRGFSSHDQVFGRTGSSYIFPSCSMKIEDRSGDKVSIDASIDGKNFSRVLTHEKASNMLDVLHALFCNPEMARCGILHTIKRINSECFYVGHMLDFMKTIDYCQMHEGALCIAYCERDVFDYVCGSLLVETPPCVTWS